MCRGPPKKWLLALRRWEFVGKRAAASGKAPHAIYLQECTAKLPSRDEVLLNLTSTSADRVVLVSTEFGARSGPFPRSAVLARQAVQAAQDEDREPFSRVRPEGDSGPTDAISLPDSEDAALAEFRELARSAGAEIVAELFQRRARPDPATLVGSGKVEEIANAASSSGASLVLFDYDLTPTQLRNLERVLPVRVVDRTQLILDIFARHARTREGQLQVELAQLAYMLPRLAGRGAHMSQLGGGIGTRGPGETQIETDRRKIQRRILQLQKGLSAVRKSRTEQRRRRESVPVSTIALVGYTNAGKSTLFNLLTSAGVLASPRMFATLDPKLRSIVLPSRRKVLLSDTVGFIGDLPHTLITAFRATLEEVEKAEVLLHLRDCSSASRDRQAAEVEKVLGELGVLDKPRIPVWNKIDLLPPEERHFFYRQPGAVCISARSGEGMADLLAAIDESLAQDPLIEQKLAIPQSEGALLAALEAGALIQGREFIGDMVHLEVAGPASLLGRYRQYREPGNL